MEQSKVLRLLLPTHGDLRASMKATYSSWYRLFYIVIGVARADGAEMLSSHLSNPPSSLSRSPSVKASMGLLALSTRACPSGQSVHIKSSVGKSDTSWSERKSSQCFKENKDLAAGTLSFAIQFWPFLRTAYEYEAGGPPPPPI